MSRHNVPFFESFFKSQLSSFLATAVDFVTLVILTELFGIYYLVSTAIASAFGAIVSFLLGRYWAFKRPESFIVAQAFRYAVASGIILMANVAGMYFFTDILSIQYLISKIIVAIITGILISFPLFRYFVYQ
ncbi:MAG: GtrA family protein [Saprospiraceae bacterium]|nr:GtrA family protein [Bacteroidia bacterium]NNF22012.1 GtrA family protein [Saprospiraceae bacterium]